MNVKGKKEARWQGKAVQPKDIAPFSAWRAWKSG